MPDHEHRGGSPSLLAADYWWYTCRARMLRQVFDGFLRGRTGARPVLDVGSADGPGGFWNHRAAEVVSVDLDPRGLLTRGVCARIPQLPFRDDTFEVVTAFDVIEHCASDAEALREVARVLSPGGLLLLSVPAYNWAWTDFDVANGHYRRYTRARAVAALENAGFRVLRATHTFAGVFPAFAAQRLVARVRERWHRSRPRGPADIVEVPAVPAAVEKAFTALCRVDELLLPSYDLGFGSSIMVAAELVKPGPG